MPQSDVRTKMRRQRGDLGCKDRLLHTRPLRTGGRGCDGLALQRYVDIFKENLAGDAADTFGSFEEIIAGLAGMLAAEKIGEHEGAL